MNIYKYKLQRAADRALLGFSSSLEGDRMSMEESGVCPESFFAYFLQRCYRILKVWGYVECKTLHNNVGETWAVTSFCGGYTGFCEEYTSFSTPR